MNFKYTHREQAENLDTISSNNSARTRPAVCQNNVYECLQILTYLHVYECDKCEVIISEHTALVVHNKLKFIRDAALVASQTKMTKLIYTVFEREGNGIVQDTRTVN